MKSKIGALVAGFLIQLGGLYVIHPVWLKREYLNTASLWRSQEAMSARLWAMLLAILIYVAGAVWLYTRGLESKPWIGQGIRFGILLALVTVVYSSLSAWAIMPIPHILAAKWIIGEGLLCVLFGLAVAAICQPRSSAA